MPLKFTTVTKRQVNYSELERFIKAEYGHKFSVCADQEWGNVQEHSLDVEKDENQDYDKEAVEKFRQTGKGQFILPYLLNDLCDQGKLEPGEYTIVVSW